MTPPLDKWEAPESRTLWRFPFPACPSYTEELCLISSTPSHIFHKLDDSFHQLCELGDGLHQVEQDLLA